MSKPLYELTNDMLALMGSEETTDEQITEVFGLITNKENKICHLRADILGEIEKFKTEEKRLSAIRKSMENKVNRLEEYIKSSMVALDITEVTAGTFKLSISPSQGSAEITDEKAIPQKFTTVVQSVTYDKTAIKSAIKSGEPVPGAEIKPGWTLRIR